MPPIIKTCRQNSNHTFIITDEDQAFYKKINVPHPTLCPDCRQQRRLAFRNERKLYNRKSDLTGKQIISVYSPQNPLTIYAQEEWWSDTWDAKTYGRTFDFNRPFFEQFSELFQVVPHIALINNNSENSEYCHLADNDKNCYLLFSANDNEDCYYGYFIVKNKNCIDTLWAVECQFCYEGIYCEQCYNLCYSQYCINCYDSYFLYNCHNCNHCIGCVNLRNKEYYILNKPYSKEEYEKKVQSFLGSFQKIEEIKHFFTKEILKHPHISCYGKQNENISGNNLFQCKNIHNSFDVYSSQDCGYCYDGLKLKDGYDSYSFDGAELCYETISTRGYNYKYTMTCRESNDLTYCESCFNSKHLFGCVGIKRGEYCILNKQYTKEEYEKLVPKIIEHMKRTPLAPLPPRRTGDKGEQTSPPVKGDLGGYEWGEFFPPSLSPFAYNETVANEYFPLSKENALKLGAKWKDEDITNRYEGPKINIPDNIKDVLDDIINQILECATCKKNYKIISQELHFYRTNNIPIPRNCPECRHKNRMALRNPRKLWTRQCDCRESLHQHSVGNRHACSLQDTNDLHRCKNIFQTTYCPDRKEIVYCEECYNKSIY